MPRLSCTKEGAVKLRNGLTLGVVLLTATARAAQAQINQRPIHWAAIGARATIRPGDTATVAIRASIAEFFHLYSTTQPPGGPIRTTVTLDSSGPFVLHGRVRAPAPDTIPDGSFGMMSEVYSDSITFGDRKSVV